MTCGVRHSASTCEQLRFIVKLQLTVNKSVMSKLLVFCWQDFNSLVEGMQRKLEYKDDLSKQALKDKLRKKFNRARILAGKCLQLLCWLAPGPVLAAIWCFWKHFSKWVLLTGYPPPGKKQKQAASDSTAD